MEKAALQAAIDLLEFDDVVKLAQEISPFIEIIEIGTPCIKYNGIGLLNTLRQTLPQNRILVDLKTMDAGEYEASPFYEAGADICTVLGVADLSTINGVINAANKFGKECQVDLINTPNKSGRTKEVVGLGAHIVGIHTGLDQQAAGYSPFQDLTVIKSLGLDVKISVAGGIKLETLPQALASGADIVAMGAALYTAQDPAKVASAAHSLV